MLGKCKVVSTDAKKFGIGQWSFIGPGSEKKWYSIKDDSPLGIWDNIAENMLLEFAESDCPIFRATTKDIENCRYTSPQMNLQLKQVFALSFLSISSVSTEQWRLFVRNLRIIKIDRVNLRF